MAVILDSYNKVTWIYWRFQGLSGWIPAEIGNLQERNYFLN